MFSVALIGPDGAGKTTLTAQLQQSFEVPLKCLYMGINIEASNHALPTSRLVEYFKRRQDTGVGVDGCGDASPPGSENAKRGLGGWLWAAGRLINRLLEEWYRQLLSWGYQILGYAVVYDRHFLYDFTLDGIDAAKQTADKRLHRWLLEKCYPRPHLTIYLDAPAEVLFARKGEKTLEELERRRQAFLQLRYRAKNFVQIDATRPFDVVYAEVSRLIEQGYRNSQANVGRGLRLRFQRFWELFD
jgi:thymidylate kinase